MIFLVGERGQPGNDAGLIWNVALARHAQVVHQGPKRRGSSMDRTLAY